MSKRFDRDYIWECDYGVRKPLEKVLKTLLAEQDANSLQMAMLLVNNIPYCLELFVVLSYDNPKEGDIDKMKHEMNNINLIHRKDLTLEELIESQGERRFDSFTLLDPITAETIFENVFQFAEKEDIRRKGYAVKPLNKKKPIFLSHSSKDKDIIEELIPYLNGAGLPVWFDKISIDYGESITEAIEKGIEESGSAIFWITKDFLDSNWCRTERRNFSNRHSANDDVLLISVVADYIDFRTDMPLFMRDLKALKMGKTPCAESIAKELIPVLRRYLDTKSL